MVHIYLTVKGKFTFNIFKINFRKKILIFIQNKILFHSYLLNTDLIRKYKDLYQLKYPLQ